MTTQASRSSDLSILRVEIAQQPHHVVVSLIGELDISTPDAVHAVVTDRAVASAPHVRLDLSGLDFCDARGIAQLIAARRVLEAEDRRMSAHNARPHIRRLLELTGTTYLLAEDPTG